MALRTLAMRRLAKWPTCMTKVMAGAATVKEPRMLDGKDVVFISCSELYKERVAYPFRDLVESLGMKPVIVSDAPKLVGTWTLDQKVEAYLDRSEVLVV